MGQQAVTSGNERKGRITVLMAGNVNTGGPVNNLTQTQNNNEPQKPNNKTTFVPAGTSLNNVGASGTYPTRRFNNITPGEYQSPLITDSIAGVADTTVRSAGTDYARNMDYRFVGDTQNHITAINIHGQNTYGASRGAMVPASGLDNTTGKRADQSRGFPVEVVFMNGSRYPVQLDLGTTAHG